MGFKCMPFLYNPCFRPTIEPRTGSIVGHQQGPYNKTLPYDDSRGRSARAAVNVVSSRGGATIGAGGGSCTLTFFNFSVFTVLTSPPLPMH